MLSCYAFPANQRTLPRSRRPIPWRRSWKTRPKWFCSGYVCFVSHKMYFIKKKIKKSRHLKCVAVSQNMVGRGEVDEDLEGETKEECEKYGKVVKCVIFEVRRINLDRVRLKWLKKKKGNKQGYSPSQIAEVTDDEAVRIFLEFERVESAIKGQSSPAVFSSFV